MADQALLNTFDALSLRRDSVPSHVAPNFGGDRSLTDSFIPRQTGPLDSFVPFPVSQGDSGLLPSRFHHLFHDEPEEDPFAPPVPVDNSMDGVFNGTQGLPPQPTGIPMRPVHLGQYSSPWGPAGSLTVGDGLPLHGQPLLSGQPLRFGGKPQTGDADIIPTAIVIKNIPFNIKREQLLQVIVRI